MQTHPQEENYDSVVPGTALQPSLLALFVTLLVFYTLSVWALGAIGLRPAVPLSFLPFLALICLPLALVVVCALGILPSRLRLPAPGLPARLLCIAAGLVLTFWLRSYSLWLLAALALGLITRSQWSLQRLGRVVAAALVMAMGYACVWNANYLALAFAGHRLIDHKLLSIDRWLWDVTLGSAASSSLVFPLWTHPAVFRLMENSYAMLFPQVLVGLLLASTTHHPRVVARWLVILFTAYAIGLGVFTLLPAVGPPIYDPSMFKPEFAGTFTAELMRLMANEFQQVEVGGDLTGFGYFVAFPSLHVAASVLVQVSLRQWPWVYWTWLPVTLLLIVSTIVLGYHYTIDIPAGLALGFGLSRALPNLGPAAVSETNQRPSRSAQGD